MSNSITKITLKVLENIQNNEIIKRNSTKIGFLAIL